MSKIIKEEAKRDQFDETRSRFIELIHRFNTNIELLERLVMTRKIGNK